MLLRGVLTIGLLLSLTACVETDLTLRADDTITGTITWNTDAGTTAEKARALFKASGITVKRAEVMPPATATKEPNAPAVPLRCTVEIEAVDANSLASAPLFKALGVTAAVADGPDGSSRTLTVSASNKAKLPAVKPPSGSVIRLHLPGSVAKTSASATGKDVTWTVPSPDYFGKPSIDLSVTYATSDVAPAAQ